MSTSDRLIVARQAMMLTPFPRRPESLSEDGKAGVLLRHDLYPLLATADEIDAAAARRKQAT